MNKEKTIREVDWGIACVSGQGNIYINKNLKIYDSEMYNKIIEHEKNHKLGSYTVEDLKQDMGVNFITFKDKMNFCLQHPKGWFYLSPIIVTKDEIMVSWLHLFELGCSLAILCFILFWVV